jgi:hypothetical protein
MQKACTKCKQVKLFDFFSPNPRMRDGRGSWCKPCVAAQTKLYNAARMRARMQNPEYRAKVYAQAAQYRKKNADAIRGLKVTQTARRRAKLKQVQPIWRDKELDGFAFMEAARLCKLRESIFGFKWHVDHVVPLNGKFVSGFHTASNIQVIPAAVNLSKHAKFVVGEI